jgi:hypothetical protein
MSDFAPFVAAALRDKSMQELLEENRRKYSYVFVMCVYMICSYDMFIHDMFDTCSIYVSYDMFI